MRSSIAITFLTFTLTEASDVLACFVVAVLRRDLDLSDHCCHAALLSPEPPVDVRRCCADRVRTDTCRSIPGIPLALRPGPVTASARSAGHDRGSGADSSADLGMRRIPTLDRTTISSSDPPLMAVWTTYSPPPLGPLLDRPVERVGSGPRG